MPFFDTVRTFFGRKDFIGNTDTYLANAIAGMGVFDVMGTYFTDHNRDNANTRLARYRRNWAFYRGDQFFNPARDGARKLVINYVKPISNKSTDWLMGQGWEICTPPGNEVLIPLLNLVWAANKKEIVSYNAAQMGSVSGDAFIQVTVADTDSAGQLLPIDKQRIVIRSINSAYCHPVYDPFDQDEMIACLIQYPIYTTELEGSIRNLAQSRPMALYSQYITRTEIREYVNQHEVTSARRQNFLGRINLVHIRNMPLANSYFGQSDVDDIIALNEEFNIVAGDIGEIINYHAAPTTVIYGARAQQLEKGAKKMWSNIPASARIENLELAGDLGAAVQHLEFLKLAIHEVSNTPEASLGKLQEISNTSNAALETQYQPLIEKTRRKYITYGDGFSRVNELILRILDTRFGFNLKSTAQNLLQLYKTEIKFRSPLPSDESDRIDILKKKVDAGFESQIGALRELNVRDVQKKAIEILADRREKLSEEVERGTAIAQGRAPNLTLLGLGSLSVSTGLEDVFDDQDVAMAEAEAKLKELKRQAVEVQTAARTAPEQPQVTPPSGGT